MSRRNITGMTPLHYTEHQEMMELLISKHHADVEARDKDQRTPLHMAIQYSNPDIVKTLLEHRADVGAVDGNGMNALELAIEAGNESVHIIITVATVSRCILFLFK